MRSQIQKRWILAAALAAIPASGSWHSAQAQFRIGQDGHALDASNQVGSGGLNGSGSTNNGNYSNTFVTGNQIVTGNVTGGRQFRGFVPYSDPLAFRGLTVGNSVDNFVRDSSGAPTANSPTFSLGQPRAFYGQGRAVAPPIGTVQEGSTGAYLQAGPTAPNPYNTLNTAPGYFSARGGTNIVSAMPNGSLDSNLLVLPSGGSDQGLLNGSAVGGIRVGDLASQSPTDAYFLNRYLGTRRPGEPLQTTDLDPASIQRMRQELGNTPGTAAQNNLLDTRLNNNVNNNAAGSDPTNPAGTSGLNPGGVNPTGPQPRGPLNVAPRAPGTDPLSSAPLEGTSRQPLQAQPLGAPLNSKPIGSDLQTSEGTVQQSLVSPSRQSSAYAEMQKRLDKFNQSHPQTPEEQALQARLTRIREAQGIKANANRGATTGPAVQPIRGGVTTRPAAVVPPAGTGAPATPAPAETPEAPAGPVKIESLASGIKASGLHDLMADAEKLMHEDKFASGIVKYNQAERVAPNNPLVPLGRAHAELGAGYYGKAEADLRKVIANDPALLMGQFDLKAVLSQQRLAFLQKDLKDLADHDVRSARPWFLLAYISYNTNDPQAAANYLAEAEKRVPKNDAVLQLMRSHWTLPAAGTTTTPDLSK